MRRKMEIVVIIVIVLIAIPCGWYSYLYLTREERNKVEYIYSLKIIPNIEGNYTIYLPILGSSSTLHKSKDIDKKLLKNIKCEEGNPICKLMDTNYGKVLVIDGNGKLSLKAQFTDESGYYQLTTRDDQNWKDINYNGKYWVFCNKSNTITDIYILIIYEYGNKYHNVMGHVEGIIETDGWQLIDGYEKETVV